MPDFPADGKDGKEPNLELPSLRLRIGRKKKQPAAPAPDEQPQQAVAVPKPSAVEVRPTEGPSRPQDGPPPPPAAVATAVAPEPPADTLQKPGRPRRGPHDFKLPHLNSRIATILSGIIVGLVGVVLAIGTDQGCQAARGVNTCGGGVGLFALIVILVIEVLVGAVLLRAFGVADPASTSFLGVALVAVIAMLFFVGALGSMWMLLVIPVLTGLTYLVAWWVTDTFVETGRRR
ncbi:MAG: low temperature requirement protein A [Actinomycetota bacterium]|nr:low temperature requirement protein A [Actinomycetota bacterium]